MLVMRSEKEQVRDPGLPAGTAGLLPAVTMAVGVPLAFAIARIAARRPHQGPVVLVLSAAGLAGCAGLYFAPVGGAWARALETLYEHSGGWRLPIAVMSAPLAPQMAVGHVADRVVEDELAHR